MTTVSQIKELEKDIKSIYATIASVTNQFHTEMNVAENRLNQIAWEIKSLQEKAHELEATLKELEGKTVSAIEFGPVKSLVYALVGLILMAVVGAVVSLVVKQ